MLSVKNHDQENYNLRKCTIYFFLAKVWTQSGQFGTGLESFQAYDKPFPLGGFNIGIFFGILPTTSVGTLVVVVEFEPLQEVFTQPHRQNLKDGHDSKD